VRETRNKVYKDNETLRRKNRKRKRSKGI